MPKRILIVDDLPFDVILTARTLLACVGEVEFVVAADGEEALRRLTQGTAFDVVLLDLHLPKVDGFEVLKELNSKPFLSNVPIIMLSSSRNPEERRRTQMLGAAGFVEKSLDYSVFKGDLLRALSNHGVS